MLPRHSSAHGDRRGQAGFRYRSTAIQVQGYRDIGTLVQGTKIQGYRDSGTGYRNTGTGVQRYRYTGTGYKDTGIGYRVQTYRYRVTE